MKPKLKSIGVKGLFGYLTYVLNELNTENAIFVIGNNGSGKSTIFNLVSALIEARWHTFHEVVFDELSFIFEIEEKEVIYNFRKRESVEWKDADDNWQPLVQGSWREFSEIENLSQQAEWIFRNCSEIGRAKCGRHWTTPTRSHVNASELVRYYKHKYAPRDGQEQLTMSESSYPDMEDLKTLKVQFIQANRLLMLDDDSDKRHERSRWEERPRPKREPIYQISDLLRENIRSQITGAFIQRDTIGNAALNTWLSQGDGQSDDDSIGVHELAQKIDKIEDAFSAFSQTARRTKLEIPETLPDGYEPFLKFYLSSRLKQLNPLTEFLKQIDLFTEICNTAFGYKELSLHERHGLSVRVNIGEHSEELDLPDLSSGEQQIIFLAYQLTIGADHNALILIDEPELSLHLEWQKSFVSLLDRIGEQTNNSYICATHSPSIVGSRVSALRNIEVNNEN